MIALRADHHGFLRELPGRLEPSGAFGSFPELYVGQLELVMAVSDAANHRLSATPCPVFEACVHEFQYTARRRLKPRETSTARIEM